jgi:hypothetical protein
MTTIIRHIHHHRQQQRGVVLWVSLMVLVVLLATAVALVRNSSLGLGIAGNLGFRENATLAGDLGTEKARVWLSANTGSLLNDVSASGYFASWGDYSEDPETLDWAQSVLETATDGNTVQYLIQRMCLCPGPATPGAECKAPYTGKTQECVYLSQDTPDKTLGSQQAALPAGNVVPFYRVTSRIKGPRDTVSYTQSMLY